MQILPHLVQFPDSSWKKVLQSEKNIFPQIKRFENGFEKSSLIWKFSLILAENPLFFPDFPDWKVFKIFPDFPDRWEPSG